MIGKLSFILFCTILFQITVVFATPSETSVAHKNKFSEKFETAINSAEVDLIRIINSESSKLLTSLLHDLPEIGKHRENVEGLRTKLNDYVEKQVRAKKNNEKLKMVADTYFRIANQLRDARDTSADNLSEEEFNAIIKKNVQQSYVKPFQNMIKDFHVTIQMEWAKLYANLDEQSLKDYPEYTTINDLFAELVKTEDFIQQRELFHKIEAKYYELLELFDAEE